MVQLSPETVAIMLGFILSIFHYVWESMAHNLHKYKKQILSMGFGVSTAYIFLQLLPEIYNGVQALNIGILVMVLIGFAAMHLIEVYSFKLNPKEKEEFKKDVSFEHSFAFFVYHAILGIILATFMIINPVQGAFFFIPLMTYTIFSSLSLAEIHEDISNIKWQKLLLSSSSLIGTIVGVFFLELSTKQFFSLLAFVVGSILYVLIKDTIPRKEDGKPIYFIIGITTYTIIVLYYWTFTGEI